MNRVPEGLLSAQMRRRGPLFGMRTDARGCIKTLKSQQYRELFSVLPIFRSRPQRYSSLDWRNKEGLSTCRLNACVFTQLGPKSDTRGTRAVRRQPVAGTEREVMFIYECDGVLRDEERVTCGSPRTGRYDALCARGLDKGQRLMG